MRVFPASFAAAMAVVIAGLAVPAAQPGPGPVLKPAREFAAMADDKQRAVALFTEAGKVIRHPRCVNCHPAGDRPMQGEDSHPHQPLVVRGDDGLGAIGMRCTTLSWSGKLRPQSCSWASDVAHRANRNGVGR